MENLLLKEIKKMEGVVLGIGINSDKIKQAIEKNNNIKTCYLLDETSSLLNKKKLKLKEKSKTINIKKIRKTFKKKRIDDLVCNYETIKPFLKTFIRDSVYINKGTLYIYGDKTDLESLINRYKRYTDKIELTEEKDKFLIKIDNTSTQNNKLKDIGYWWSDTGTTAIDFLTTFLVN